MKRLLFLIFLGSTCWAPFTFATPFQVISRNNTPPPLVLTEVPLAVSAPAGANWGVGLASRDADHGTVAMANNKDIVVAFHSVRWKDDADGMPPWDDLPPEDEDNWEWGGTMKQVELAYYKYSPIAGGDAWTHIGTKVLGGIEFPVISLLTQRMVKCERPDVIAVKDKFFVVWTRRYHHSFAGQDNEPAVLECAWVERAGDSIIVHDSGIEGKGFALQTHVPQGLADELFEIRECGGVPDAVALIDSQDATKYKVAVVYPHQTQFSDQSSLKRKFTLRVITCTIDSNDVITKTAHQKIYEGVPFHGNPAPVGMASPGLILPDLAPSSGNDSFWMVHERQRELQVNPGVGPPVEKIFAPDGRVRLDYVELNGTDWEVQASKTYKTPSGVLEFYWRRRPTISCNPLDTTANVASIAFGKAESQENPNDPTTNVVYDHWEYTPTSTLVSPPTYPGAPTTTSWPNSSVLFDDRPAPLSGRLSPLTWRCYATRSTQPSNTTADLMSFDPLSGVMSVIDSDTVNYSGIRRPATAYFFDSTPGATDPDYFVVTWEKQDNLGMKRVHIGID